MSDAQRHLQDTAATRRDAVSTADRTDATVTRRVAPGNPITYDALDP
jgi:hypothetical protein